MSDTAELQLFSSVLLSFTSARPPYDSCVAVNVDSAPLNWSVGEQPLDVLLRVDGTDGVKQPFTVATLEHQWRGRRWG